jgi:integrase
VLERIRCTFAFGIAQGWCAANPADPVGEALRARPLQRQQLAILNLHRARQLLAAVDQLQAGAIAKAASTFLALTGVRLAALRGARWDEIEDLDGAAPLWRVPAARMKLGAEKKLEARFDHLVPLAPAAAAVLRVARRAAIDANMHSGDANMHGLIFPGAGADGQLGEDAIGALYDRAGFAGEHVPHGWRATFSTILNDELGESWRGDIDRALGHVDGSKVERAYNRSVQLGRRCEIMERWAELLIPALPTN